MALSRAAEQRAWRARNPDKVREYNRRAKVKHAAYYRAYNKMYAGRARARHLLKKYGITLETWNALLAAQNFRCKICRCAEPSGNGWHTDHAGPLPCTPAEIRGILCTFCNHAVKAGSRADAVRLRRTVTYVESFL